MHTFEYPGIVSTILHLRLEPKWIRPFQPCLDTTLYIYRELDAWNEVWGSTDYEHEEGRLGYDISHTPPQLSWQVAADSLS